MVFKSDNDKIVQTFMIRLGLFCVWWLFTSILKSFHRSAPIVLIHFAPKLLFHLIFLIFKLAFLVFMSWLTENLSY